jgi:hypothetical protein
MPGAVAEVCRHRHPRPRQTPSSPSTGPARPPVLQVVRQEATPRRTNHARAHPVFPVPVANCREDPTRCPLLNGCIRDTCTQQRYHRQIPSNNASYYSLSNFHYTVPFQRPTPPTTTKRHNYAPLLGSPAARASKHKHGYSTPRLHNVRIHPRSIEMLKKGVAGFFCVSRR